MDGDGGGGGGGDGDGAGDGDGGGGDDDNDDDNDVLFIRMLWFVNWKPSRFGGARPLIQERVAYSFV